MSVLGLILGVIYLIFKCIKYTIELIFDFIVWLVVTIATVLYLAISKIAIAIWYALYLLFMLGGKR